MDVVSVLRFLDGLGGRRQIVVAATILLALLALLVYGVGMAAIDNSRVVDGQYLAPFRWGPDLPTGLG